MVVRKRAKSIRRSRHDVVQPGSTDFRDTDGALWIQEIALRDSNQRKPMGFLQRQQRRFSFFFNSHQSGYTQQSPSDREQFTIKSTAKPKSLRRRVYEGLDFETPEYSPSVASMKYVNWTFTVTSPILFLHILFFYLVFTFFFALLLLWAGKVYPKCITVDGSPLSDSPNALADSFALSWTTFSTVGYGMAYGGTAGQQPDHGRCTGVILILTTEALVGLLYSGMCAAILFGKVNRVQSHAPILFSHALCVMYSENSLDDENTDTLERLAEIIDQNEQMENFENEVVTEQNPVQFKRDKSFTIFQGPPQLNAPDEMVSQKPQRESIKTSPFSAPSSTPISRPIDQKPQRESIKTSPFSSLSSTPISRPIKEEKKMDILKVVEETPTPRRASAPMPPQMAPLPDFGHQNQDKRPYFADAVEEFEIPNSSVNSNESKEMDTCPNLVIQIINQLANKPYTEILDAHLKVVAVKQSENGRSKIYTNVALKETEHPFFQRVWHAMHTLNQFSTLLTTEARKTIAENGGWPSDWNSSEVVREKLCFTDLIITMSGIANISGSQVIKHKRFQITDLLVGYEFAPLLYHEEDNATKVDMSLINDVVIQRGINSHQASTPDEVSTKSIRIDMPSALTKKGNQGNQGDQEEFGDHATFNGIRHR